MELVAVAACQELLADVEEEPHGEPHGEAHGEAHGDPPPVPCVHCIGSSAASGLGGAGRGSLLTNDKPQPAQYLKFIKFCL